ncbi:phytanoyl-CoA dioxygenase family protein [Sandarakinorhabdus cyanobacteriorum]|nr:phytanoyl-CoA dioxygenase family protein [Sandarakinorhabdus cyanobacteriorum]
MKDAARFNLEGVEPFVDPTTGSGNIFLMPEGMGSDGKPFVFLVQDPPHKTRPRHYHHGDVLYVYTHGEHHIEGEGVYRAGDLRWTRAGHAYGPETTGPEGGSWWVISYSDPLPVDVGQDDDAIHTSKNEPPFQSAHGLPTFERPYDWKAIDQAVTGEGGAILVGLLTKDELDAVNSDIDGYIARDGKIGLPQSGSPTYDAFLGARTVRLHGLAEKTPSTRSLLAHPDLVAWAERVIGPNATSVLLNAGELIQIGPGEPAQYLHRDTDSWLSLPRKEAPVLVNAIIALDPFTLENGATYISPGSWRWEPGRQPKSDEFARALMSAGDAVLFRGDLIHGGGENASDTPRRAISISYCAGWLRPVENSFLNVPRDTARTLEPRLQALLGYAPHDAVAKRGGMIGLFENGDPARALENT